MFVNKQGNDMVPNDTCISKINIERNVKNLQFVPRWIRKRLLKQANLISSKIKHPFRKSISTTTMTRICKYYVVLLLFQISVSKTLTTNHHG